MVTPDWLFECIKAKKIVEAKNFHPKYLMKEVPKPVAEIKVEENVIEIKQEVDTETNQETLAGNGQQSQEQINQQQLLLQQQHLQQQQQLLKRYLYKKKTVIFIQITLIHKIVTIFFSKTKIYFFDSIEVTIIKRIKIFFCRLVFFCRDKMCFQFKSALRR